MRKIKILHIITRLCAGGAREVVLKILNNLDRERFDVTLIYGPEETLIKDGEIPNVRIIIIDQLVRNIDPVKDFIALLKLYFFMSREKFDIVHTHTSKAGILGRAAARLNRVPIILHMSHGSIFHPVYFGKGAISILSVIEKIAAFYTDKIIVTCESEKEDFINNGIGSEDKYIKMPDYLFHDKFSDVKVDEHAKRAELNIPEGVFLLANVARLVPEKGHIFCLKALRKVIDEISDVMLLIVGEGRIRESIERKIIELNLQKNVFLTGFREDIPEIFSIVDISLHTSLWEGTPLTIAEAMSSGKAIIATAVGGIPEMISDGVNGILVQPQNIDELTKQIIRLLRNKELLASLGRDAKEYARVKFNSKYVIDEVNDLYDAFLKRKVSNDVS